MTVRILLILVAYILTLVASTLVVQPPAWPQNWSAWYLKINSTYPSNLEKSGGWWANGTGLLREDLTYGCNNKAFADSSCRGIFKNGNFYLYSPVDNVCCLSYPNIMPTPPNWLVNISTATGTAEYEWTGQKCTVWQFMDVHTYYADLNTGLPVAERGGGTDLTWYSVSVSDFNNGDVFALAKECSSPCSSIGIDNSHEIFHSMHMMKKYLTYK
eukprot:202596_1